MLSSPIEEQQLNAVPSEKYENLSNWKSWSKVPTGLPDSASEGSDLLEILFDTELGLRLKSLIL